MTEKEIFEYFIKQGLTVEGACGLMGNLYAESGLRFNNLQNSFEKKLGMTDKQYVDSVDSGFYKDFVKDGGGFGISQTTYWTRKQNLLNFAKKRGVSIADPKMQLDFLMQELKTSFKSVYKILTTTTSVQAASDAVLLQFEKPKDQSTAVKTKRLEYSEGYLKKYGTITTVIKPSNKTTEPKGSFSINKDYPCNKSNYGSIRDLKTINYIVLHYTGNKTDSAINNAKYFNKTPNLKCSAHYFIDQKTIYQSVDDNYIAYAVGKLYSTTNGGGKYFSVCKNSNSISIEMCSNNGIIEQSTIDNTVKLVRFLMDKYNIPITNILTHFMVCGKNCPGWTLNTSEALEVFKKKVVNDNQSSKNNSDNKFPYKAIVNVKDYLNIRNGASMSFKSIGKLHNNEIVEIIEEKNGFGRLKNTDNWISISYIKKIE